MWTPGHFCSGSVPAWIDYAKQKIHGVKETYGRRLGVAIQRAAGRRANVEVA